MSQMSSRLGQDVGEPLPRIHSRTLALGVPVVFGYKLDPSCCALTVCCGVKNVRLLREAYESCHSCTSLAVDDYERVQPPRAGMSRSTSLYSGSRLIVRNSEACCSICATRGGVADDVIVEEGEIAT